MFNANIYTTYFLLRQLHRFSEFSTFYFAPPPQSKDKKFFHSPPKREKCLVYIPKNESAETNYRCDRKRSEIGVRTYSETLANFTRYCHPIFLSSSLLQLKKVFETHQICSSLFTSSTSFTIG